MKKRLNNLLWAIVLLPLFNVRALPAMDLQTLNTKIQQTINVQH